MSELPRLDAAIIGGGYYGCFTALEIKRLHPGWHVAILEKEADLFARASSTNQGILQRGYLYSGDPALAHDCVARVQEFETRFGAATHQDDQLHYAVHQDSELSAADYQRFCQEVGLPLRRLVKPVPELFGPALTTVFETAEKTFDNAILQRLMRQRLQDAGVQLALNFAAERIEHDAQSLAVFAREQTIRAKHVFNATFADINHLHDQSQLPRLPLRHDVFLHFKLKLPEKYRRMGVVTVRGPFAALSPARDAGEHVLASARFRKVRSSQNEVPKEGIDDAEVQERWQHALDEASVYLPVLRQAVYRGHILGTRTAFFDKSSGSYSSKALLFADYGDLKNYHVVLGGKVGCLSDIAVPLQSVLG